MVAELQWQFIREAVCPASVMAQPELACAWQELFPGREALHWREVWGLLGVMADR